jgi:hypothetical protein
MEIATRKLCERIYIPNPNSDLNYIYSLKLKGQTFKLTPS